MIKQTLADVKRAHVAAVLVAVGGHKARAARILGISRGTLYHLIARYGIVSRKIKNPTTPTKRIRRDRDVPLPFEPDDLASASPVRPSE